MIEGQGSTDTLIRRTYVRAKSSLLYNLTHPYIFSAILFFLRLTSLLNPYTTSRKARCCLLMSPEIEAWLMDDKLPVSDWSLLAFFIWSFCGLSCIVAALFMHNYKYCLSLHCLVDLQGMKV